VARSFRHGRFIYDSLGWYARLRLGDAALLDKIRVPIAAQDDYGLTVGPFRSRRSLERWFNGFLALHSRDRHQSSFISDDLVVRKYRSVSAWSRVGRVK